MKLKGTDLEPVPRPALGSGGLTPSSDMGPAHLGGLIPWGHLLVLHLVDVELQ